MMQFNEVLKSRKDISELKQKENLYLDCHLISNSKFKNFGLICVKELELMGNRLVKAMQYRFVSML